MLKANQPVQGRWAVAITEPRCESKAVFHAMRQGFECYAPRIKFNNKIEPLFPRYVFVACNDAWRALLSTFGITGVITHAEKPAVLADSVVQELKARCDADGFFIQPPPFSFRRGMRVRVKCGVLAGALGTVHRLRGQDRVEILIKALGAASVRANVCKDDIVLA